jgi:Protein of unknown function (DUF1598)
MGMCPRWYCFVWCLILFACQSLHAQNPQSQIDQFLKSGEFAPALEQAKVLPPAERDAALAAIANAQSLADAKHGSLSTLTTIQNQSVRANTASKLRQQSPVFMRGGGPVADFETLIDLTTSTIAPDTWIDNGGKGTIAGFPTGVIVNSTGVMQRVKTSLPATSSQIRVAASQVSSNRNVQQGSRLRKISLPRLERAIQARYAAGEQPTETMKYVAGLTRIQYVFIYEETGDIVIAGPAGNWEMSNEQRWVNTESKEPVLQLDDFVCVLRNAYDSQRFGCAITPTQENLAKTQQYLTSSQEKPLSPGKEARAKWLQGLQDSLGMQEIEVHGIDSRSHAARVIVEADHHMKLIGMGLEKGVDGVTGYLDSLELKPGETAPNLGMLRWWFTLGDGTIRATADGSTYSLPIESVKVLSENEILGENGRRIHTGTSNVLNLQFARSFTNHFPALCQQYPVYAELRNVFDWATVAALMRDQQLLKRTQWEATHFLNTQSFAIAQEQAPKQVMTVANSKVFFGKTVVAGVSGGVEVNAFTKIKADLKTDSYGDLSSGHDQSSPKAKNNLWWWD